MDDENMGFDDRLNSVVDTIMADEDKKPPAEEDPAEQDSAAGEAELPKEAIGEDGEDKTKEAGKDEQQPAAIEPPVSWPSDSKEAFKALPTWAQEQIVTRENEREAHFSERSRTMAAREREVTETTQRANAAQQQLAAEHERLNMLAAQLMPAKFSDIKNEADYLRMKATDPARASEYDAFQQILHNNAIKQQQLNEQRMKEQLNREYTMLVEKAPEFKDPVKAKEILDSVRKTAVEYYGFQPEEVKVISDHRHVQVLRDALSWRQYQANVKAAAAKKTPAQLTPTLRPTGNASASVSSDQKAKVLNRARNTSDMREKADMIASLL